MIKTCIFDIGNVVLYFSHEKMVQQMALILQIPFALIKTHLFDNGRLHLFELGAFSLDHWLHEMRTLSSVDPPEEVILQAWNDIFRENDTLTPVLRTLKKQGKKLLLLSNISEAHFNYIWEKYPSLQLFDGAIVSYKIHHAKPEPEIYQAVLQAAGCETHECFYTDDILAHVNAARKLGIDAELFESTEQLVRELARRMVFV